MTARGRRARGAAARASSGAARRCASPGTSAASPRRPARPRPTASGQARASAETLFGRGRNRPAAQPFRRPPVNAGEPRHVAPDPGIVHRCPLRPRRELGGLLRTRQRSEGANGRGGLHPARIRRHLGARAGSHRARPGGARRAGARPSRGGPGASGPVHRLAGGGGDRVGGAGRRRRYECDWRATRVRLRAGAGAGAGAAGSRRLFTGRDRRPARQQSHRGDRRLRRRARPAGDRRPRSGGVDRADIRRLARR